MKLSILKKALVGGFLLTFLTALILSLSACGDDDDKVNSNSSMLQGAT